MRIFLAGATGVIGRRLLPRLLEAGHAVSALTRSSARAAALRAAGAEPVVADVFDAGRIGEALENAAPEVVIHQLTALPGDLHPRRIRAQIEPTNRLRDEGTRVLLAAAEAAGARRFVAQSVAFAYRPDGGGLRDESAPLFADAPAAFRPMVAAVASLERQVAGASLEGVALRYGFFYGAGTVYADDGSITARVRKRGMPVVGDGAGVFSFVHVDDAAAATVAALDAPPGVYNVVDDDPAPVREWLPAFAAAVGAPPPFRVPRFLGRLAAGPYGVYLMCDLPGASNRKAREVLGWAPRWSSWRDGFREAR